MGINKMKQHTNSALNVIHDVISATTHNKCGNSRVFFRLTEDSNLCASNLLYCNNIAVTELLLCGCSLFCKISHKIGDSSLSIECGI